MPSNIATVAADIARYLKIYAPPHTQVTVYRADLVDWLDVLVQPDSILLPMDQCAASEIERLKSELAAAKRGHEVLAEQLRHEQAEPGNV